MKTTKRYDPERPYDYEYTTSPEVLDEIERRCVQQWQEKNPKRISVRTHCNMVRDELKVSVNSNDQSALTDRIIRNHPGIPIKPRARGRRGPNNPQKNAVIKGALRVLREAAVSLGLEVTVTFTSRGQTKQVKVA